MKNFFPVYVTPYVSLSRQDATETMPERVVGGMTVEETYRGIRPVRDTFDGPFYSSLKNVLEKRDQGKEESEWVKPEELKGLELDPTPATFAPIRTDVAQEAYTKSAGDVMMDKSSESYFARKYANRSVSLTCE